MKVEEVSRRKSLNKEARKCCACGCVEACLRRKFRIEINDILFAFFYFVKEIIFHAPRLLLWIGCCTVLCVEIKLMEQINLIKFNYLSLSFFVDVKEDDSWKLCSCGYGSKLIKLMSFTSIYFH